ncbi:hypothetical protein FNH22_18980 [Fulvivirga sp. M361]|uniref:alpha-L-fucosidase n=1 Tax=Fulvivirga sp. M361 TaxID=2594266 RepID=UPI00117AB07F|nr:alpha-L-fucosidase [Fulvivirga sp. M361]TRX54840.1 hypothetical protein FNH22_18980 [Fulvivirga sp. M361]
MKIKILKQLLLGTLIPLVISCTSPEKEEEASPLKPFDNTWTSLRQHQTPQWLIDAKFGIYCHWGIQTLEYIPEYADLSVDERIALFKGEKFDADHWAALFETAGAKFGGVIGWHGSDFKHWDSDLSEYNSSAMGPKIDIVGEVSKAVRKKGMKFLVSYHSIEKQDWIDFAKEGVEKYDPDIFWVDASFGGTKGANHHKTLVRTRYVGQAEADRPVFPEKYQRAFITHFFNRAIERGKEVEFVYKSNDIPPGVGMRDLENGILSETAYDPWMTDMDMSVPPDWETHGWFYREGIPLRSADELVDMIVDVVSKNGIFLLNIPPRADGTFPQQVVATLTELGDWLRQNGEAIYGTSPWFIYGEGPNEVPLGNYSFHHNNHFAGIAYSNKDIRFTTKGDFLYATCLGNPGDKLSIPSLNASFKLRKEDVISITHLSSGTSVKWDHHEQALDLDLEGIPLDDKANSFKITLDFNL